MTRDTVKKLRELAASEELADEAADRIEAQAREIARLTECIAKANRQTEHFEREWYLRGDALEAQAKEIARLREALEHIGIYGCGMLNQPPAMNGPEEDWLKQRIFEMERTARAALAGGKP